VTKKIYHLLSLNNAIREKRFKVIDEPRFSEISCLGSSFFSVRKITNIMVESKMFHEQCPILLKPNLSL